MDPIKFPSIPPMNDLLEEGARRGLEGEGREALRCALDSELEALRNDCRGGHFRELDDAFWDKVSGRLAVVPDVELGPAVNGTGVVLHTNLGRAPWPEEAIEAAARVAGYGVLEVSPQSGARGRRGGGVSDLLAGLTGAEDGLAVNNNAGAVLLTLSALARGRKVVVLRGEQVEIGGSYRMPEVVEAAGAEMVEIGTTNRVHLKDFERALEDPEVACVCRVHPSNFEVRGFTSEPSMEEIAQLCKARGVTLYWDLGSGVLSGSELPGVTDEPTVAEGLTAGCDLVSFSGDKLLGGPQSGLIVGAAPLVARLRRDMLTRCLRLDKTILAGLEATLRLHALGEENARIRIPSLAMLSLEEDELRRRAEALVDFVHDLLPEANCEVVPVEGRVGSGASPLTPLKGWGVRLTQPGLSAEELSDVLRNLSPPWFGRVQEDAVLLDARTAIST